MGFLFNSDRICRNCTCYSISECFCNLHNQKFTPANFCSSFREMSFLEKAFSRYSEYTPKVIDNLKKVQEKNEKTKEDHRREVQQYKSQYSYLDEKALVDELNRIRTDASIKSRKARYDACIELLNNRGFEIGPDNKIRRKHST